MQIIEARSYDDMSRRAANVIAAQINLKQDSVLGLATGSSPVGTYRSLIERYQAKEIDFAHIKTFNLDEYVGLSPESDQSYRYFMESNLFNHVNIIEDNINFLNGVANDLTAECVRYENRIEELGGIDLQLLGMGHNGHIAFNEPSDRFERATFPVELTQSTIEANKRFFASEDEVPRRALTMGIGTIMQARVIVVVVSGTEKAHIVERALNGPICPEVPASILQLHGNVIFIGDTDALALL